MNTVLLLLIASVRKTWCLNANEKKRLGDLWLHYHVCAWPCVNGVFHGSQAQALTPHTGGVYCVLCWHISYHLDEWHDNSEYCPPRSHCCLTRDECMDDIFWASPMCKGYWKSAPNDTEQNNRCLCFRHLFAHSEWLSYYRRSIPHISL